MSLGNDPMLSWTESLDQQVACDVPIHNFAKKSVRDKINILKRQNKSRYHSDILLNDCQDNDGNLPKPFKCLHCKATYTHKANLTVHTNNVHAGVIFDKHNKPQKARLKKTTTAADGDDSNVIEENALVENEMDGVNSRAEKPKRKGFVCKLCHMSFGMAVTLREHMKRHAEYIQFRCLMCSIGFLDEVDLKNHMRVHYHGSARKNNVKCAVCLRMFLNPALLHQHIRSEHDAIAVYECSLCGNKFMHESALIRHHKLQHRSRAKGWAKSNEELLAIVDQQKQDLAKMDRSKLLNLPSDDNGKTLPGASRCHIDLDVIKQKMETNNKLLTCDTCSTKFATLRSLRLHQRAHSADFEHVKCPKCPLKFVDLANMKSHVKIHNRQPAHRCHLCNKMFGSHAVLNSHMRVLHSKTVTSSTGNCMEIVTEVSGHPETKPSTFLQSEPYEYAGSTFLGGSAVTVERADMDDITSTQQLALKSIDGDLLPDITSIYAVMIGTQNTINVSGDNPPEPHKERKLPNSDPDSDSFNTEMPVTESPNCILSIIVNNGSDI